MKESYLELVNTAGYAGNESLVPREGFEPTPPKRGANFKSAASALSPPGPGTRAEAEGQNEGEHPFLPLISYLEATGGFEPPNKAFAELRLNHLATSPQSWHYTTFGAEEEI